MLGVLGGMGPAATVDFMEKVIANTPGVSGDQGHIPMLVLSASNIPDRSAAILGHGADPFPAMLAALRQLERAGATRIAIPCNTAHYWHDALQASTALPILHIAQAVCDELDASAAQHIGERAPVGVLATAGTRMANVYGARLAQRGYASLWPDEAGQREVTRAIALVKAGRTQEAFAPLAAQAEALWARGCRYVLMACTEIPVALADYRVHGEQRLLDATDALARACVASEGAALAPMQRCALAA